MRQAPRNRHCLADGFTLLELLVATTVVSLLASAILVSWRVTASAWGKTSHVLDQQRRVSAAEDVLQNEMNQMMLVTPWVRDGDQSIFFEGEPQTARFVSRYSLSDRAGSGPFLIEYQVAAAGDGTKQLLMNEVPLQTADQIGPLRAGVEQSEAGRILRFQPFEQRAESRVLLEGMQEIGFEYYKAEVPSVPGAWISQWISQQDELPRGMAIRLTAAPNADGFQPSSVVADIPNFTRSRR